MRPPSSPSRALRGNEPRRAFFAQAEGSARRSPENQLLARNDNLLAREANDSTALSPHNRPVMKKTLPLAPLVAVILLPFSGNGEVTVTVQEVGSDVVINYTGSWDNWVLARNVSWSFESSVGPFGMLNRPNTFALMEGGLTKQSGLWTQTYTPGAQEDGDFFGWVSGQTTAQVGYTAGDLIEGSITFRETDLATLGFTAGDSGSFSGNGNTVNFSVTGPGVSAIPEPSSLLGLAGLITGSTFLRRRKRA